MPSAGGTAANSRRSSSARVRRSGRGRPSSRSARSGARSRGSTDSGADGGGHQREVRRRDGGAQSVEHEGGERGRVGGGQQGVDVGEQEDDGRVRPRRRPGVAERLVHAGGGGSRLQRGGARRRELDPAGADRGGGAAHEGRLADALGADEEHAEPG